MARLARVVLPGIPHPITQRGRRREEVFLNVGDRSTYLEMVAEAAEKFGMEFCAWCLMPNHVHFLAVPKRRTFAGAVLREGAHGVFPEDYLPQRLAREHRAGPFCIVPAG